MSHPPAPLLPLALLERHDEAIVDGVVVAGPLRARLEELGLVPGAHVRLLQSGSPLIVLVGGETRLCLRADEADSILVSVA
jgi:Fe2+ transport system protein FeoA